MKGTEVDLLHGKGRACRERNEKLMFVDRHGNGDCAPKVSDLNSLETGSQKTRSRWSFFCVSTPRLFLTQVWEDENPQVHRYLAVASCKRWVERPGGNVLQEQKGAHVRRPNGAATILLSSIFSPSGPSLGQE